MLLCHAFSLCSDCMYFITLQPTEILQVLNQMKTAQSKQVKSYSSYDFAFKSVEVDVIHFRFASELFFCVKCFLCHNFFM